MHFAYSSFIEGQIFRTIKSLYLIQIIFLCLYSAQEFILRTWINLRVCPQNNLLQFFEFFLDREIKLKNMDFHAKLSKLDAGPENLQNEQIGSAFI